VEEKPILIDTHAHILDSKLGNPDEVLARALGNGVEKVILPTTEREDWEPTLDFVLKNSNIYMLVGIHPENCDKEKIDFKKSLEELMRKSERVVGVGEVGLDFYYDKEKKSKEKQIEVFEEQIQAAIDANLPMAIHMREAEEETESVIKNFSKMPVCQYHCFAGSEKFLKRRLDEGCFISFAGNVTFKTAFELRERLLSVPLERLLLETDSPYLSPEPVRGTINEPGNVRIIASYIAKLFNISVQEVAEVTTKNAKCLYCLEN